MKLRPPITSMTTNVSCNRELRTDQGALVAANASATVRPAASRCQSAPGQANRRKISSTGGNSQTTLRVNAARPSTTPAAAAAAQDGLCQAYTISRQKDIN